MNKNCWLIGVFNCLNLWHLKWKMINKTHFQEILVIVVDNGQQFNKYHVNLHNSFPEILTNHQDTWQWIVSSEAGWLSWFGNYWTRWVSIQPIVLYNFGWIAKNGCRVILPKNISETLMVLAYQSQSFDFDLQLTRDQLEEINFVRSSTRQQYKSKDAAIKIYGLVK